MARERVAGLGQHDCNGARRLGLITTLRDKLRFHVACASGQRVSGRQQLAHWSVGLLPWPVLEQGKAKSGVLEVKCENLRKQDVSCAVRNIPAWRVCRVFSASVAAACALTVLDSVDLHNRFQLPKKKKTPHRSGTCSNQHRHERKHSHKAQHTETTRTRRDTDRRDLDA